MNSSAHTPQMKQKFRRTVRPIHTSFLHEFLGCRAMNNVERHLNQLPWCHLGGSHALGSRHTTPPFDSGEGRTMSRESTPKHVLQHFVKGSHSGASKSEAT